MVKKMFKYEVKKVFLRTSSKLALLLLLVVTGSACLFAMNVTYVNENGESQKGPAAAAKLKSAQKEWAGYLDEEKVRQVIARNRQIQQSPEAQSTDEKENEIAYAKGQGISEIRDLLNISYSNEFREYDYFRADTLSDADAVNFYSNRITLLTEWLHGEAKFQYSDAQKEYLLNQYREIKTPFYYDYMKGWTQLFEFAPTIIMITMLILGYIVAGIFSCEFAWKSDAVFFTSTYGRDKAVVSKIKAGFYITTAIYWAVVIVYSFIILIYFGADGWSCPVQSERSSWKCFYNITVWQKYLLIVIGGYIGSLFVSFLCMLASAKTKSTVFAVIIPFVLIFIPSFLGNIGGPVISKILGLLPDQLLQTGEALNCFNLYSVGGKVFGEVPVLMVIYTVLTVVLLPVIYREYRNKQIS